MKITREFFCPFGNEISLLSPDDYVNKFSKINCKVSDKAHRKEEEERWIFKQFIDCMIDRSLLPFPTTVTKSEQPDFIISNENRYGLEITEATHEGYQMALSLARERGKGEYPINTFFANADHLPKTNLQDTFQKPGEKLHGMPIYGDHGFNTSMKLLINTVIKKTRHLNLHDYQDLQNIELLILSGGPTSIYTDIVKLSKSFSIELKASQKSIKSEKVFSKIHILQGRSIIYNASSQAPICFSKILS